MKDTREQRAGLSEARRIVVKIGSRVLVQRHGRPDARRMQELVRQLSMLHAEGREIAVVSSGAIGAGMEALGLRRRPANLPDLQMAAAVGQSRLMAQYGKLFGRRRRLIGQVLLTQDGLRDRVRHLNARNTLLNLLRRRIIPIINENDAVAVDEIRFGDNDQLAALVALLIDADLLILLTTVDGLREPVGPRRTRRITHLGAITSKTFELVAQHRGELSTGGMRTKLEAATMVAEAGAAVVIADGRKPDTLLNILAGKDIGTLVGTGAPLSEAARTARKRWIAYFHRVEGTLVIDDGAARAIEVKGKSLLPIGIRHVIGDFGKGALVNIKTPERLIARGLTDYTGIEIRKIMGHKTQEIAAILGVRDYTEVVHRDNMVLLTAPSAGPATA